MCSLERHGKVALKLLGEKDEHWLNPDFMSAIARALSEVQESDAGALVTGNFFSNGLDVAWAQGDPESRWPRLVYQSEALALAYMKLGIPTVASICGHAAGSGVMLALAHDHQFMRRDRGFYFSTRAGNPRPVASGKFKLPPGSFTLPRLKMSPKVYKDFFLCSTKHTATTATELGIIDGHFADASETFQAALRKASELADMGLDRMNYRITRMAIYREATEQLEEAEQMLSQVC